MAKSKEVVAPGEAIEGTKPADVQVDATPPKVTVVFWKRMNPFEKINFKDGTHLVFGRQNFATADEKLIEKIDEVAKAYGIFRR